ncbi:hypothetical protein KP79_PYT07908 [Mizuhopecten yessoensis]|uniref:Uncharacterized protein n=1 Tax=Mizuhopecten yessoensis TaxID=6573 RepID=A0A210PMG1_MIZYE|nr:hypothetical protein KP79_PYT07908 [Mizuhopecten yessoensis]
MLYLKRSFQRFLSLSKHESIRNLPSAIYLIITPNPVIITVTVVYRNKVSNISQIKTSIMCGNSTEDTTENLFTSNQFIGITAGLGTFLFIGIYLYCLWKCTCGSPDDDKDDKQNRVDDIRNR